MGNESKNDLSSSIFQESLQPVPHRVYDVQIAPLIFESFLMRSSQSLHTNDALRRNVKGSSMRKILLQTSGGNLSKVP